MDNVAKPSRLFQDLLNLEKDFKYNLTLLQVRDAEIERCSIANKTLQEMLKAKLTEIEGLTGRLSNLEEALQKSEQERESEKQVRQQIVTRLTENLNEVTRKLQARLEQNTREFKDKQVGLEKSNSDLLLRKETEYRQNLKAMEERLEKEISSTSKTMNRLQKLIDENMSLRNKIRQLESQYTSETYFYKNEFRTVQSTNSNLNSEIECLKESYASLEMKFGKIRLENDNLRRELCVNSEKISNLIKQNKEIVEENNKLGQRVEQEENLCKELILDNELLTREKSQLEFEFSDLKQTIEQNINKIYCNVSSHNNWDFIIKQNGVLQELVKAMRKEREKFIKQNNEAESRLEKLENLMELLKQRAVKD